VVANICGNIEVGFDAYKHDTISLLKLLSAKEDAANYSQSDSHLNRLIEAQNALNRSNKTIEQTLGDFFQYLWTQLLLEVQDLEDLKTPTPAIVVLAIPVESEDSHIRNMRIAAIRAGILDVKHNLIPRLFFVPEPEAVHHTLFENYRHRDEFEVKNF
jgi:hypothetical protein